MLISAYFICLFFSILMTGLLARKRGDFPTDHRSFIVYFIWVIPIVNVIYGLAIIPYFFSDNPYRINS
jgi:hypothetical protein